MSSRCHADSLALLLLPALLAGCNQRHDAPASDDHGTSASGVIASALIPGLDHSLATTDKRAAQYFENADAVVTGRRLYVQYNCVGCHSNGGGGMGPALMDDAWIYGGRLEQIHQTLVEGRPNGMPSWGGKVPDAQLWQIAAYVRSMSLPETLAAQQGPTPSLHPAPLPRSVEQDGGWKLAPSTTNDYTSLTAGPP